MKGTYCLIIKMNENRKIRIGKRLGLLSFEKGYYVYIGSAMNSLESRVKRHLSHNKKRHWHADYLLLDESSNIEDVLINISDKRIECELAGLIRNNEQSVAEFGCSDCSCSSHLVYFEDFESAESKVVKAFEELSMDYTTLEEFSRFL